MMLREIKRSGWLARWRGLWHDDVCLDAPTGGQKERHPLTLGDNRLSVRDRCVELRSPHAHAELQ